jgi:hypothetical protein
LNRYSSKKHTHAQQINKNAENDHWLGKCKLSHDTRYQLTSVRIAIIKKNEMLVSVCKNAAKGEPLYAVGENIS